MKKLLVSLICAILGAGLIACGDGGKTDTAENVAVEKQAENTISESATADIETDEAGTEKVEEISSADPNVDLDLTALSSTMIYSEVFNMMMAPEEYEGKTIKMDGNCSIFTDEESGATYYACIVQDATQCCSQGLEFVLTDNYSDEDYPADGDEITITGKFSTYTENDLQYISIIDSVLE